MLCRQHPERSDIYINLYIWLEGKKWFMCGYFTTYVDVKMKCKMLSLESSETVNVHQPAKNLRFLLFILFFHITRFDLRCMNLDKRSITWRSFWPLLSHQQHRVENAFVLYRHQWSTRRPVVNLNDDSSVMADCWKAIKTNTRWFFFCLHLRNTDYFSIYRSHFSLCCLDK